MTILDHCKGYPKHAFDMNEVILREGSQTGLLYVLLDGTVEIVKQGLVLNTVSEPGAIFGEVSSLLNTPHMATVRALVPCRLYVIQDAKQFLRTNPELGVLVAVVLAQRLSSVTNHLTNVSQALNTLMKRQTAPNKASEERSVEKPLIRVFRVGALQQGRVPVH